jgi:excisionase family DNA binding protein
MTSLLRLMKGVLMMEQFGSRTYDRAREYPLKLEDVADILNVEVSTVRGWVKSKRLSCSHMGPGFDMRFRMDDVMNFILK